MQYALFVETNNAYCMGHETDNAYCMGMIMHMAWGMRLIMHMTCVLMFLSLCKVMPDVGSLNRNM